MKPRSAPPIPPLSPLSAAILIATFCGFGFAAIMEWAPATVGDDGVGAIRSRLELVAAGSAASLAPSFAAGGSGASGPCGRCGVVESVRAAEKPRNAAAIESLAGFRGADVATVLALVIHAMAGIPSGGAANPAPSYEVTVRFHDGSSRVLTEVGPRAWKPGDPVRVINGRIEPVAG